MDQKFQAVKLLIYELCQHQPLEPAYVEQMVTQILDVVHADGDLHPSERNRLANELHDTVSQTLWSISLIAERLPSVWHLNREEGEHSLMTLHQLAQSALSEMRSLMLELRPSKIQAAKLGDLIRELAAITSARTGLSVKITAPIQDPLPSNVQVALYRVTQEALNNIMHHASATHIEIYLNSHAGQVELTIQDNGRGFDPTQIAPGRYGLSLVRDRIKSIGGTLEILSQKDEGTLIKVIWISMGEQRVI